MWRNFMVARRIPKDNPDCELCGLCQVSSMVCMPGVGKLSSEIMVVGDMPGFEEDRSGIPFSSKSGKLVKKLMRDSGLDPSKAYFTYAVKCRTSNGKPPSAKEIKSCNKYLSDEIKCIKPKFVLLLGAVALKAGLNKAKITEIHGNPIEKDGVIYFPMFSPSIALRDPRKMGPVVQDMGRFAKVVSGDNDYKHKLNLTIVNSLDSLEKMFRDIISSRMFSYDIETTGLNRFAEDSRVNMLSVSTMKNDYVVPFHGSDNLVFSSMESQRIIFEVLASLSKRYEAIAQNGKFDNLYLRVLYGIKMHLSFDTMLAAHCLDENSPLSLKYNAQRYLEANNWDIDLETKKGQVSGSLEKLCEYAAWDTYFTIRLRNIFKKKLSTDEALPDLYYKLYVPLARAYENIESNGVYINRKKQGEVKEKTQKELDTALRRLDSCYDKYYRKKKRPKSKLAANKNLIPLEKVNWNSSKQIKKILFEQLKLTPVGFTPKGDPSTSEDFINRMAGQHPILEPLLDYRHAQKMMSSFIIGWEKRMVGDYLFPGFKVGGTVTGRPSSSDPNLQQVPKKVEIRSQISAPPGWTFFEIDYSQLELRVAAIISGDRELTRIFQIGGDVHSETASAVTGIPIEDITAKERKNAKAVNFGFIYGMGWTKFKDYAQDKYGVILTDKESQTFRNRYFAKYSDLPKWHERQRRLVRTLGQVRTFTGRIRRLPEIESPDQGMRAEAERAAINAPVQGFGAEMLLMALIDLDKIVDPLEVKLCGTIHDALVGIVRDDVAMKWLKIIKTTMENPSLLDDFKINLPIPITADVSLGDWGAGEEIEDL